MRRSSAKSTEMAACLFVHIYGRRVSIIVECRVMCWSRPPRPPHHRDILAVTLRQLVVAKKNKNKQIDDYDMICRCCCGPSLTDTHSLDAWLQDQKNTKHVLVCKARLFPPTSHTCIRPCIRGKWHLLTNTPTVCACWLRTWLVVKSTRDRGLPVTRAKARLVAVT